jgi:hypothetical protein
MPDQVRHDGKGAFINRLKVAHKIPITNPKFQINSNFSIIKQCFYHWNLDIDYYLDVGAWKLVISSFLCDALVIDHLLAKY